MYRRLLIIFSKIAVLFGMAPPSLENVFTRHTSFQMKVICEELYEYASIRSAELYGTEKLMFETITKNLKDSLKIVENAKIDRIFFGWTPLRSTPLSEKAYKISRNDNDEEMVRVENIPLYFIFVKVTPDSRMIIEKIVHNPSIDVDIDPVIMKKHLRFLANESGTKLDVSQLKEYDNGRWYLILSDVINFKSLPDI